MLDSLANFGGAFAGFMTPGVVFTVLWATFLGIVIGALPGLTATMGVALMTLTVMLNWEAPSWDQAGNFAWWHVGVVLLGAFAGGTAGFLLGRRWYPTRSTTPADGPVIEVAPGERVSWVGRTSVRWPLSFLGLALVAYVLIPGWGVWLAALFVLIGLAMMQVEANVNNDGLVVRLGGIPVRRIGAPAEIAAMCGLLCSADGGFVNGQMIGVNGGIDT